MDKRLKAIKKELSMLIDCIDKDALPKGMEKSITLSSLQNIKMISDGQTFYDYDKQEWIKK